MCNQVKKISLLESAIWFFVPGIWIYIAIYYLVPRAIAYGISEYVAVMGSIWSVTIPFIPLSYILYIKEHRNKKIRLYCQHFRFKKLGWIDFKYLVMGVGIHIIPNMIIWVIILNGVLS